MRRPPPCRTIGLSDNDARDISAYLIAQSTPTEPPIPSHRADAKAPAADPTAGATLYGTSFCASCHAVQNAAGLFVGGNFGPELTRIGTKVKTERLADWVRNPRDYDPKTTMPHYRLDRAISYAGGIPGGKADLDFRANEYLEAATPAQIENGKTTQSQKMVAPRAMK